MALKPVWVVVADGGAARFFVRQQPGTPLREVEALAESGDVIEHPAEGSHHVHQHTGHDPHSVTSRISPRDQAEQEFLRRVAKQIDKAVEANAIGQLALCASPRALGVIRDHISGATRAKLVCEIPKDIVREPVDKIDERLKEHRV